MPAPPSTSNFRDYVQNPAFVPTWLRGPIASRMLVAMAAQFDGLWDLCALAIRARFPSTAPDDAFTYLQSDRQVDRGFQESLQSFALRLVMWLDLWRLAGSPYSVLLSILGYVTPDEIQIWHVSNTSVWDGYDAGAGASPPQSGLTSTGFVPPTHIDDPSAGVWNWDNRPWQWWRFWVVLFPDAGLYTQGTTWGAFRWGDGTLWGLGGPGASQGTAPSLKAQVKKWKTQGAFCPCIIVNFDPTSFQPASLSAKLPDGTYNPGYKVITVGTQRVYVSSRLPTASYIDGDIT